MKRGKKPFNFDIEVLEKIEVLASRGLAQQDIAYCIGIHPTTLSEKKSENEQLQEALKKEVRLKDWLKLQMHFSSRHFQVPQEQHAFI